MIHGKLTSIRRVLGTLVAAMALACTIGSAPALANVPVWRVSSMVVPAHIAPGGTGQLIVTATNLGDANALASGANPIKIGVELPEGVAATEVAEDFAQEFLGYPKPEAVLSCEPVALTCQAESGTVLPYQSLIVTLNVSVAASAGPGLTVRTSASGGGAAAVSRQEPFDVSAGPLRYGVEKLEVQPLNEDGSVATQAGSHPFQLTTAFTLNENLKRSESFPGEGPSPVALPKELKFALPAGLVGNPSAIPQCSLQKFEDARYGFNECPPETVIGVAAVIVSLQGTQFGSIAGQPLRFIVPLDNVKPSVGEPARFGFVVPTLGPTVPVLLDTSVRTGGDYGVVVSVHNISEQAVFLGSEVSFWGVPADPRHNAQRGRCLNESELVTGCNELTEKPEAPLLTLPTSCSGPSSRLTMTLETSSWSEPSAFTPASAAEYSLLDSLGHPLGLDGCNHLPFSPTISVAPDSQAASTPTGLTVGVHVPQQVSLNPTGLAEADVKDTTVTLPAGVTLNPSAADGLESCTEAQIALESHSVPTCPDAAKVGTVEIHTPLLPNPLTGAAYLAAQNANPFGSLVALYIVAQDPVSGVLVKLAGEVKPDQVTGQLVSTFENTPQLPFEDLKLHFFGGSRAPLSTPALCGGYTTIASIAPWSGNAPAEASSEFKVTTGPNGSACSSPLPFSPSLTAGSTNIQTGAFSPFTMTMSREDGNQNLGAVRLRTPAGLLGTLSSVKLCGEAEANTGMCGPESLIGETVVSVGLGGDPFSVRGGKVYITGPYHGAPFGLSIVNPAKAGPFDLGQVIVRAKIEVDPITAALTVTTDGSGPYAIPQILDGIPLEIKHINVTINRPNFTFNPTNCTPTAITASLTSGEGAIDALSVPFQVTNCATLAFKPQFKVSTAGKTSRANGASLDVKLAYPKAAWGSQANIKSVKVDLPKQLPSRLTTLQKACTSAQFESNPAGCPAASIVGHATAITPVLPVPITGPAYFVSHGGAKFPELVILLQGYGVTVDLHGETFISKAGITSSTFKQVPDVPVTSFDLNLPQGTFSALAANGNLCQTKLKMPTAFVAQNGATIHLSTPITVTGCVKHKTRGKKVGRHGSTKDKKKG